MKRTIGTEPEDTDSSFKAENLVTKTPGGISDHEVKNSSSLSVMAGEAAWQNKVVTDPLTQQLAHLWELMRELKNKQSSRPHEETA